MQVSEIDNVKIYNLSAGKSLPEVCIFREIIQYVSTIVSLYYFIFSGCQKEKDVHC